MFLVKALGAVLLLVNFCTAYHKYVTMKSEEIDSRQHGQQPGSIGTTCKCGWANKGFKRIVGGEETKVNEFPFIVGLTFRSSAGIFCGGTIISPTHILTAAHCLYDLKPTYLAVIVGEHDVRYSFETSATEKINVKDMIIHERYDTTNELNDIAILILERDIKFNDNVGPACLPKGPIDLLEKYIKVMGWGDTVNEGAGSPYLKKVNLRVIPLEICAKKYKAHIPTVNPTQYCTYSKRKDSCQGDSGGPNVWLDPETNRYTLVGVVSFGGACASVVPGVNTDVTKYVDWIDRKMKQTNPKVTSCTKK